MVKTNNTVHPGYASYSRGTETANIEGLWLGKDPNTCAETPRQQLKQQPNSPSLVALPFYSSLLYCTRDPCDII